MSLNYKLKRVAVSDRGKIYNACETEIKYNDVKKIPFYAQNIMS